MPAVAVVPPYTLVLREDDDITNPRKENDCFGQMICFHSRYNLGDEHSYQYPRDFLCDLVETTIPDKAVIDYALAGKAKYLRLEPNTQNDTLEISADWNHTDNWEISATFKGATGYETDMADMLREEMESNALLTLAESANVVLPLFLYDHSGLSIRTSSFVGDTPHAEWDSSQVGWICAREKTILAEYGGDTLTEEHFAKANALLQGEISIYDSYLRGECYGFQLYENGEEIDSCWGFLGPLEELKEDIQCHLPEECAGIMEHLNYDYTDSELETLLSEQERNHIMEGDFSMNITEPKTEISFKAKAHAFTEPKGNVLGLASLNIGDVFAINNIRIMNSEKGVFVALPSSKDKEGNFKDICHPTTKEGRAKLNTAVMDAYNNALLKNERAAEKPSVVAKLKEAEKQADKTPKPDKTAPDKSGPEL